MKKEISPFVFIGAIAAMVIVVGVFIYKAAAGNRVSGVSPAGTKLLKVMEHTNGDVNKMTTEEKAVYDESIKSGYYQPRGYASEESAGGANGGRRGPGSSNSMGTSGGMGASGNP